MGYRSFLSLSIAKPQGLYPQPQPSDGHRACWPALLHHLSWWLAPGTGSATGSCNRSSGLDWRSSGDKLTPSSKILNFLYHLYAPGHTSWLTIRHPLRTHCPSDRFYMLCSTSFMFLDQPSGYRSPLCDIHPVIARNSLQMIA